MAVENVPEWMAGLEEDVAFIRNFIMASGSLKQISAEYGVTYPTVRLRLDFDTAKLLIHEYKKMKEE